LSGQSCQYNRIPDGFVNMMAPLKRPAASQDASPYKKRASSVDYDAGHAGLMQRIQDGIWNSSAPPLVKDMLNISMDYSLGVEKNSRHKFQEEVVDMIAAILGDEEKKMRQEIDDANGAVEKCVTEEASQAAVITAAKAAASALWEALATTQVDFATAEKAVQDKMQACNHAEHELNAIKDEVNRATHEQSKLNTAAADVIKPVKDGEGISKDLLDSFIELCTILACDAGMVQAIPAAFGNTAEKRGGFDKVVIEHVEKFVVEKLAVQEDNVGKIKLEMSAREAKAEAAKAELQQSIQQKESLESEVAHSDKVAKIADSDVRAAVKTLKALRLQRESLSATAEVAKAQLETFHDGALAAFKQLMEHICVPPVQHASVTED